MSLTYALITGIVAIGLIIVLIARFNINSLLVLFGVAIALLLAAGDTPAQAVASFQHGAGNALGSIGFLLAFGTMFGKLIAQSGAADTVALSVMARCGARNLHWAMAGIGMIVGLPIFFDVGFILLAPLAFIAAQESRKPVLFAILPLMASLSIAHAVMPPHPAIMQAIGIYHANLLENIALGLLIMVPTAIISGPLFTQFIMRHIGRSIPARWKPNSSRARPSPSAPHWQEPAVHPPALPADRVRADADKPVNAGLAAYAGAVSG